ncbi:DUF7659 family protein [Priestia aryabhattai]
MSNAYLTLKRKQEKELSDFPMVFAFSQQQFNEGMIKLGLLPEDKDKVYSIPGGGFIRKTDSQALNDLIARHAAEKQEAVDNDATGEGYIYDMFRYELANHEYGLTRELDDTLNALGYTFEEIEKSKKLTEGLKLAHKALVG